MKSGSSRAMPPWPNSHHRLRDVEIDHRQRARRLGASATGGSGGPDAGSAAEQPVEQRRELGGGDVADHRDPQPVAHQRRGVGGADRRDVERGDRLAPCRRPGGHRDARGRPSRVEGAAGDARRGRSRPSAAWTASAPAPARTRPRRSAAATSALRSSSRLASRFSVSISRRDGDRVAPGAEAEPRRQRLARLGEAGGVALARALARAARPSG